MSKREGVKLSREQIRQAVKAAPIESVLAAGVGLTGKQKEFARAIAAGESKAGAYRKAYKSKGKPETQSRRGQELMQNGAVRAQVEAFRLANEAAAYATPAALRALVIERLTAHAIDDDINPAQRLKALELLGKVTEVAAFTERREIVQTVDPSTARANLLQAVRLAVMSAGAIDVQALPAASDAATINGDAVPDQSYIEGRPAANGDGGDDATHADPPRIASIPADDLLSNPHTESTSNSAKKNLHVTLPNRPSITPVRDELSTELSTFSSITPVRERGEGVQNVWTEVESEFSRGAPVTNWQSKG